MFRWMRRYARLSAFLVMVALAIAPLQGCGTTASSGVLSARTAKHVILIVADGMQLEHERAANMYLFGNDTSGLAHWNFDYKGAATTWDVTTYNRYAFTAGKGLFSGNGSVDDLSSFDPALGYDPSRAEPGPIPRTPRATSPTTAPSWQAAPGAPRRIPQPDSASAQPPWQPASRPMTAISPGAPETRKTAA